MSGSAVQRRALVPHSVSLPVSPILRSKRERKHSLAQLWGSQRQGMHDAPIASILNVSFDQSQFGWNGCELLTLAEYNNDAVQRL